MASRREELILKVRNALGDSYEVGEQIGHGGAGIVFHGWRKDRTEVAIKVLRPELAPTVEATRFVQEIDLLSSLAHPGILRVLDAGEADDIKYLVMPFAPGGSLRDRLERTSPLPLEVACDILRQLADAIDYAHVKNVVHRDLKPENVLFDETERVVICDFGIARAIVRSSGDRLTTSGFLVGTPPYVSPEQGSGSPDIGPATDIYSLGCVAYEMIAGRVPFTGNTSQIVINRHIADKPRSLRILRPEVPEALDQAVLWALAKSQPDRPQTATEMVSSF